MKRFLLLLTAFTVTFSAIGQDKTVKIMSYNIRNGMGMDDRTDYDRSAGVIVKASPDICAVQEVDSVTGRSGNTDVLQEFARRTGMHPTYAKAIDFMGGGYGIGLLSKEKPEHVKRIPLPGREEARVALVAEFADYVVIATHLTLTPADRIRSIEMLDSIAGEYIVRKPVFLAGDLNLKPDSENYKLLNEKFTPLTDTRQPTFPADTPRNCIDYIMGYAGGEFYYRTETSEVIDAPIESDHRPILSTVRYGKIFRTNAYLQNPVDGGITVMWLTGCPTYSWVEYGTDTTQLTPVRTMIDGQAMAGNTLHKIRINNLEPGKKYYYRVRSKDMIYYGGYQKTYGGEAVSPFHTFSLPAAGQKDFTAVVFNDLHQNRETTRALCDVLRKKGVEYDFAMFNGDCIDDPANQNQAVGTLSFYIDEVGGSDKPLFFMRGNHEIRNAYSIGLRDLFDYVGDKTYGAFNWGDTRIVMLDCGEDKPDSEPVYYGLNDFTGLRQEQLEFLNRELNGKAFKQSGKRFLIHHVPTYGILDGWWYNPCLELWHPELKKAKFDVAINGHMHKFAYYPAGSVMDEGLINNYPIVIGGGPKLDNATVIVVERRNDRMTLTVWNPKGEELLKLDL